MTEDDRLPALIEDIIARARVPGRRERDDLRRELRAHFEDAARVHGSLDGAIAAFGSADDVARRLLAVYAAQRRRLRALRLAAGSTVSLLAALAIELLVSRPAAFRDMATLAAIVVATLVIAHELARRRPRPSTAGEQAATWLAGFLALAAWEYGVHNYIGVPFSALRAATAGGVLAAIAASTAIIMACADRAFTPLIHTHDA